MILSAIMEVVNPQSRLKELVFLTSGADYTFGNDTYIPILTLTGGYQQTLFSRGTTYGDVSVGVTNLEVDNTAADLDYLKYYGVAGHKITIHALKDRDAPMTSDTVYFSGSVVSPDIGVQKGIFTLMNKLQELDVPCTKSVFLGTNAGPVGFEGNEETIKNQIKPMIFGIVQNIPLYAANTSDHIYSFNYTQAGVRKRVEAITAVRDKGGNILPHVDYATAALLQAATVPGGYYGSCRAEAMIKLGTRPLGEVTADVQEAPLSECSAPRVVQRMLLELAGFVAGEDFVAGDLEILHGKNACPVGIYITSDVSVLSASNQILDAIGGWMCPESNGVVRFGRLEDPANLVSDFELNEDIFARGSLKKESTGEDGKETPCQKYELGYSRNWKPIPASSLLESIDENLRGTLAKEYSTVVTEDARVLEIHPKAVSLKRDSLLVQARSILVPGGACLPDDALSFINSQISGAGGSVVFDGKLTINPGTGVYKTETTVPGAKFPAGEYFAECSLISGTLQFAVGTDTITRVNAEENPLPIAVQFTHAGGDFTITLTAFVATGAAVLANVRVRALYPGLSAQQESDRRFSLHSRTQSRYTLAVDFEKFKNYRPGQVSTLTFNRFDLGSGQKFVVIGKDGVLKDDKITFDLWKVNEY